MDETGDKLEDTLRKIFQHGMTSSLAEARKTILNRDTAEYRYIGIVSSVTSFPTEGVREIIEAVQLMHDCYAFSLRTSLAADNGKLTNRTTAEVYSRHKKERTGPKIAGSAMRPRG